MAAIDIIRNMSNYELVKYYKFCMGRVFDSFLNRKNIIYHPNFEYCKVVVGKKNIHNLHYSNEMSLLNEMWNRYLKSDFLNASWWEAQHIFQTNISYGAKERMEENPIPYCNNEELINNGNVKTISCNGEILRFHRSGSKRAVFISASMKYVVKIPIGEIDTNLALKENEREAEIYRKNPNSIYAKCHIVENGWLEMEFVSPVFFTKDDEYPSWILNIAECQVGYNLDGKLVAYDYGSDI